MIINWLMQLAQTMVSGLMALVPNWTIPPALLNLDSTLQQLLNMGDGLAVWFNWPVLLAIFAVPMSLWASGLVWKIAVWVWSKVPVIGSR